MAVIVHSDEPIDLALKRLHREVVREDVFNKVKEKRYNVTPTSVRCAITREKNKQKRKHSQAQRKLRNKGI